MFSTLEVQSTMSSREKQSHLWVRLFCFVLFFITINLSWFVKNHVIIIDYHWIVPGVDVWWWDRDHSLLPSRPYIQKWQPIFLPQRSHEDSRAELGAGCWGLAWWVQGAVLWPWRSPHRAGLGRGQPHPTNGTSKEAEMQKFQMVLGERLSRLEGSHRAS